MDNEMLFMGLFQRLHGSGLHPVLSGELAAANYPTDEHMPLRAVRCRQDAVNWHTEAYLDRGTSTLNDLWFAIWGVEPLDYMGVAPGSPGARELGFVVESPVVEAPTATPNRVTESAAHAASNSLSPDEERWLDNSLPTSFHERVVLTRLYSGSALPASAPPLARFFADLMCGVAYWMPDRLNEARKGRKRPQGWEDDMIAAGVAFAIWWFTPETRSDLLVTGVVGDYYRTMLGRVHPELPEFIEHVDDPVFHFPSKATKLSRVIVELSDKRQVKFKKNVLELVANVAASHVMARGVFDGNAADGLAPIGLTRGLQRIASSANGTPPGS